jgi:peroxiredoxin
MECDMMGDPRLCTVPDQIASDFEIRRRFSDDLRALVVSRQADFSRGVGDQFPAFSLADVDGVFVSDAELLSIGPLVVTFYRGIWCPYCNADLHALESIANEIRQSGALLIAISPQAVENNRRAQTEIGLSFPVLRDQRAELASDLRIRWTPSQALEGVYRNFGTDVGAFNGDGSWALPMPARYVVAQDGTILYAKVNPNYTHRPEPSDVLPLLEYLRRIRHDTRPATFGRPPQNRK